MLATLDTFKVMALLNSRIKAHISFYDGLVNRLIPVWYFFEKKQLLCFPAMPCNLEKLVQNTLLCFELESLHKKDINKELVIWGTAETNVSPDEKNRALNHFTKVKNGFRLWEVYKLTAFNKKRLNPDLIFYKNVFAFRIKIHRITECIVLKS